MRQIALDTETTGLSTEKGHRVVEIGCVEMINRKITGNTFHCYLDPERAVDSGALAIHGLSNAFLSDHPKFRKVFDDFIGFIAGAELVIHNAPFDVGFLNYEFSLLKHAQVVTDYCSVIDTLLLARQLHPGLKNSLDALCKRYEVDNSRRELHGALLDATLLAQVYLAMSGGQGTLFSENEVNPLEGRVRQANQQIRNKSLLISELSQAEEMAHQEFLDFIKKSSGSLVWEEE